MEERKIIESRQGRVTVRQAAKKLRMDVLTVQCLMKNGQLPIGYSLKKKGKSRYGYYIYRQKLDNVKAELGLLQKGARNE